MATIDWVPRLLNSPPVVFRGMTMAEVGMMTGLGLAVFVPISIPLALVFHAIALVPSIAFLGTGIVLAFGGTLMTRLRRGRPTALVYREAQLALAKRGFQPRDPLIIETAVYAIRRPYKSDPRNTGGRR